MNIGQLFVQLGVKGGDSAKKEISGVRGALIDAKNSSLETKAAIVGVVYGLERMMNWSMKMGTGLSNFAHLTNMSAEALQRWQYAGRQVNVSNEAVESSFKGVQRAISDQLMGKGSISGLGMLSDAVGGFDIARAEKDVQYAMGKIQQYVAKNKGALANQVAMSFGVNEEMIAGMRQMAFTKDVMAKAPVFSDKEIKNLSSMNASFENMFHKLKMFTGGIFAKEGKQIIAQLEMMANALIKVGESVYKLAKFLKVFEGLSMAADLLGTVINSFAGDDKEKDKAQNGIKEFFGDMFKLTSLGGLMQETAHENKTLEAVEMSAAKRDAMARQNNTNTNFNQTLVFKGDGSNQQEVKSSVKDAVNQAFRQMSAQGVSN